MTTEGRRSSFMPSWILAAAVGFAVGELFRMAFRKYGYLLLPLQIEPLVPSIEWGMILLPLGLSQAWVFRRLGRLPLAGPWVLATVVAGMAAGPLMEAVVGPLHNILTDILCPMKEIPPSPRALILPRIIYWSVPLAIQGALVTGCQGYLVARLDRGVFIRRWLPLSMGGWVLAGALFGGFLLWFKPSFGGKMANFMFDMLGFAVRGGIVGCLTGLALEKCLEKRDEGIPADQEAGPDQG